MRGRIDLPAKYSTSASLLENFLVKPQGGIFRRPGTRFIREMTGAEATGENRMIEFSPNTNQSFALRFTANAINVFGYTKNIIDEEDTPVNPTPIATPFSGSEIKDLYFNSSVDTMIITHENHPPHIFTYQGGTTFTLETLNIRVPPFRAVDSTLRQLSFVETQNIVRLKSSESDEFDALVGEEYVEFRLRNDWAIGRVLSTTSTPPAPADPAGNTCYIEPVTAIIRNIDPSARFQIADNDYDSTFIDEGKIHIRSRFSVFNYDLRNGWMRFEAEDDAMRSSATTGSDYAPGGDDFGKTWWVKISDYIGTQDYALKFVEQPNTSKVTAGRVYRIIKGNVDISNQAPLKDDPPDGGTPVADADYDNSYRYNTVGQTLQLQNHFQFNGSQTGDLEDLNSLQSFDIVEADEDDLYEVGVDVYTLTGAITLDDSYVGHLGELFATDELFYDASTNPKGARQGQFILARHSENYITYKIESIINSISAEVSIVEGDLPTKEGSDEILNNGAIDEFYISEFFTGNYPRTSVFYDQRLVFAGTPQSPETIWFSKVENNLDFRIVENNGQVLDTTAITYSLNGSELNRIIWMSPSRVLLIGTQSSEWQVRPNRLGDAITPSNINISQESNNGSSGRPFLSGSSVFFLDRAAKGFLEFFYNYEIDGFEAIDLNVLSNHMFSLDPVVDYCYQQKPLPIFWFVTKSGKLFSLTYNRRQEVYAWARHSTPGKFLSCATLYSIAGSDGNDRILFTTERQGEMFLETLSLEYVQDKNDPIDLKYKLGMNFLDCHTRVDIPTPTDVIQEDSLDRFDGWEVDIVADGAVTPPNTVDGDSVGIPYDAEHYALVGLPYLSQVSFNPLNLDGFDGPVYGRRKRIHEVMLYLVDSLGFTAETPSNPNDAPESFQQTTGFMDQSPDLFTGFREASVDDTYSLESEITIKQTQPYPLTILSTIITF